MIVLGLDPATRKFGWSLVHDGCLVASGCWTLSGEGKHAVPFPTRMAELYANLVDINNTVLGPIDVVAIELPYSAHPGSLLKQGKSLGVVDMWAGRQDVVPEVIEVNPTDLKTFSDGNPKASKEDMLAAAKRRLGLVTMDDNEADAALLGLYGWEEMERRRQGSAIEQMAREA